MSDPEPGFYLCFRNNPEREAFLRIFHQPDSKFSIAKKNLIGPFQTEAQARKFKEDALVFGFKTVKLKLIVQDFKWEVPDLNQTQKRELIRKRLHEPLRGEKIKSFVKKRLMENPGISPEDLTLMALDRFPRSPFSLTHARTYRALFRKGQL